MALQLITGPSGSGKSYNLFSKVASHAADNPRQRHLVLVPEQFTLQTQRELVLRSENHGILNIEVLSFERLAYRVFDELGTTVYDVLEDTGKSLLLRKICTDLKDKLNILTSGIDNRGFIDELKSLLSEFALYGITPEQLGDFLRVEDMGDIYYSKIKDLITIYTRYEKELEGSYITSEQILSKLLTIIENSEFVKDSFLAFDGYTGFTPVQNKLFERMLVLAKEIWVTVTLDDNETSLFDMSLDYIKSMMFLAKTAKTKINNIIKLSNTGGIRYVANGMMEHLERNLFRLRPLIMNEKKWNEAEDVVRAYEVSEIKDELIFAASQIRRMIKDNKELRFRDFAVLCSDINDYQYIISELFEEYEIPVFVDSRDTALRDPFIELVEAVVHLFVKDFSYEAVLNYLKCAMSGIDQDTIDLLDNYLLATGIRGFMTWNSIFDRYAKDISSEELVEINKARESIIAAFSDGRNFSPSATARDFSEKLYYILLELNCEKLLKERAARLEEEHDLKQAQMVRQLYPKVMELLDKIVGLMGDVTLNIEVFEDILNEGLQTLTVGVIPPSLDCVTFGDIERTRIGDIHTLFLIGLSDAHIPKRFDGGGILLQSEREKIKQYDIELAPTDRENTLHQKFYLYLALTKPSRQLILTSPRFSHDGESVNPSYLLSLVTGYYEAMTVERISSQDLKFDPDAIAWLPDNLSDSIREYERGRLEEKYKKLFYELMSLLKTADIVTFDSLIQAGWYIHHNAAIPKAVMNAINNSYTIGVSASRLEKYASCAYAYFLKYILDLRERSEHKAGAADMGSVYHEALERYSSKLEESEYDWFNVTKEVRDNLLSESVSETFLKLKEVNMFDSARETYLLERMKRTLRRTVETLTSQVRHGSFVPKAFEVSLSEMSGSALRIPLDNNLTMKLSGIIDRMDWYETDSDIYIKIIDYKSGVKDANISDTYEGLQLQLLLYMRAATEKKDSGKIIHPAAMFYYTLSDPMLLVDSRPSSEELEQLIAKELRVRGFATSHDAVIDALDDGFKEARERGDKFASANIPVEIKKDGSYTASSRLLTEDEFVTLEEYTSFKASNIAKSIADGNIDIRPYRKKDKSSGCDYCPYHAVCKFDVKLDGFEYRKVMEEKDNSIIIKQMKQEMSDAVDRSAKTGH